ncbi:MAG: aspartyl protease family protein [Acidobacteriota bacterium]|nr:aspartyl protease family protein [Acidobacteriota bacterium]
MKSTLSKMAAGILASLVICVAAAQPAFSASLDNKTYRRAEKALRTGEYELAAKIFRELLAKDSLDHPARLGLSFALLKQRLLQDAYDQAARVIMADPLSARAHSLLGSAILASGDFRNSVEEFRTALSLKQDESLAIAGFAMIDFYENRLDSSIRGLRRAVELDSEEADYVFYLGQATARRERYKEAADAYERFLEIAPKTDADRRDRIRGLIDFLRYLGKQSSLYVLTGKNKTTLSFEALDGRPILKVRINGDKEPLRFVLDTGSGMSVISELTAKKLGLKPVARGGLARAVGGGGRFEIVYGFLSSLEVGDVRVENVPVYIRHFYDQAVPVDGYLGLAVISRFVAALDYTDSTFTLRRDIEPPFSQVFRATLSEPSVVPPKNSGIIEIPVRSTSSGFISGEVRVDGIERPLNFIIDTGASVTVVSERLAAREDLTTYLQTTRMRVFGAAGVAEDVKTVMLPRVMLGTFARENISAAVLDLEPLNETTGFVQDGILGANFLRHFRTSFDFQRGLIRLEPLGNTAKADEVVDRLPVERK